MARGRYSGPLFVSDGGSQFFAILPPEAHILNAYRLLLQARELALREFPGREGRARALAIDVVLKQVQSGVDAAAIATANEAERLIKDFVKATQVRPDPPGRSGRRPSLHDAIVCRPIRTSVAGGGVGIGDISELDKVADEQGQAFWRAQEFGSSHNVGRSYYGFFQPGFSYPGEAPSRTHPLFEVTNQAARTARATSSGRSTGRKMTIRRPIPERAFLRDGTYAAEVFRQRALGRAVAPAIPELRLIQSGNHPRLKAARQFVRGRRPR